MGQKLRFETVKLSSAYAANGIDRKFQKPERVENISAKTEIKDIPEANSD